MGNKTESLRGLISISMVLILVLSFNIVLDVKKIGEMEAIVNEEGLHIGSVKELDELYGIIGSAKEVERDSSGEISWVKVGVFSKGFKVVKGGKGEYNKELEVKEYGEIIENKKMVLIYTKILGIALVVTIISGVIIDLYIDDVYKFKVKEGGDRDGRYITNR